MSLFFCFVSSETKRIYFGFRVNYLHNGVNWPIALEFVIENVNILELENKLVNTRSLNIAKTTCTKHKREETISQIGRFDDLSDFRLD